MKKSFFLKGLIALISVPVLFTFVFAQNRVEIKKKPADQTVVQFKGFNKLTGKVVNSKVDPNAFHAIRFICDNNMRLIIKLKADATYEEAFKRAVNIAKSNSCKNPKAQTFYEYSYGCNNMQTNKWDTFVNEEDWTVDLDSVRKRAEQITDQKRKANPKAYKNASCGGGGSSGPTQRETELNLKEKNIKIITAQNVIKMK